jgi:hypothetical protein
MYIGIPLHYNKLRREDLQPLIDKMIKRIAGWRGKLLTQHREVAADQNMFSYYPYISLLFHKIPYMGN